MNEHEQLLQALHLQTQTMQAMTKAVSDLAQSNRELIAYMVEADGGVADEEPVTYLSGKAR